MMENASALVTTTGVSRLRMFRARKSMSNETSSSPAFTGWPSRTWTSKPAPSWATLSRPMCISSSAPLSARRVTAWRARCTAITVPSQGACRVEPVGSMARPSPSIRSAKTASGASSNGVSQPAIGATRTRLDMTLLRRRRLGRRHDLNPVDEPHRLDALGGIGETEVVTARRRGDRGAELGHALIGDGRRQRQGRHHRALAAVQPDLELALGRGRRTELDLLQVGADLEVERTVADAQLDAGDAGQVRALVDPARGH